MVAAGVASAHGQRDWGKTVSGRHERFVMPVVFALAALALPCGAIAQPDRTTLEAFDYQISFYLVLVIADGLSLLAMHTRSSTRA